ncbi:hypothetical protein [Pseudorhodoplanes sp.]|uniref:hypothetical protein n=1 Tax=Pseudorhodoplanes sp. TaxID=1934341 RepID=UPI00391B9720
MTLDLHIVFMPLMARTFSEQFAVRVETFLQASGFKPTEFGRQAIGDASFILNLRRGRSPTLATADKVLAFIEQLEAATVASARNRRKK